MSKVQRLAFDAQRTRSKVESSKTNVAPLECPASNVHGPRSRRWTLDLGRWTLLLISFSVPIFSQTSPDISRITIDSRRRFQIIDGFGVNFNGTYFRHAQKPMIDRLIDDLGATIFRLDPYGISNWETANDNDDPNVM